MENLSFNLNLGAAVSPEKPLRASAAEEAPAEPAKPGELVQEETPVDVAQAEVAKPVEAAPEEIPSDDEGTSAQATKKKKKKNKFCRCC